MSEQRYDPRENPADQCEAEDETTLNEQERAQARRQGAIEDDDTRELGRVIHDADFRRRMHTALDRVLDARKKKGCVGDRAPGGGVFARDDFWDDFLAGRKP